MLCGGFWFSVFLRLFVVRLSSFIAYVRRTVYVFGAARAHRGHEQTDEHI